MWTCMYVPNYSETKQAVALFTYFTTKLWKNVVIYSLELKNLISDF